MPWENVGNCGNAQMPNQREWRLCQLEMGIRYLRCVCGEPPKGYELEVMWHEHDCGDYPTIGVCWGEDETIFLDAPWEYVEKCRVALQGFDEAISWSKINPLDIQKRIHDQVSVDEDAEEQ